MVNTVRKSGESSHQSFRLSTHQIARGSPSHDHQRHPTASPHFPSPSLGHSVKLACEAVGCVGGNYVAANDVEVCDVELEAGDVEFVRFSDRGSGSANGFQAKSPNCFLRRKESSDRGTHSVLLYSPQKPLGLLFRFSACFFTRK